VVEKIVATETPEIPGLGPGERVISSWSAQAVEGGNVSLRRGLLVLTNRRCLFLRRAGLLGGRRFEKDPVFAAALERLRTASPHRFYLRIGYGDRMEIPGINLTGHEFQLDRETPSRSVLLRIADARASRLAELRDPISGGVCNACGAWSAEPSDRCAICGAPYRNPAPA
jgi:hypothetical protein